MKKALSLFILLIAIGACSTSPTLTAGQQIAKELEGTWQANTSALLSFVFSGSNLLFGADPLTLANPDSIVLGNKTYAVYVNDDGSRFQIFRAEDNNLFNITGSSLEHLQQQFNDASEDFTTPRATRK